MTKVTVLLTSYNHADYIKKSVDSILNQTFKDFELIIIDDCSTDNSWDIIKSYNDEKIKKIRNKKNKGSIMCRELVETFKGEYFAIAHCDDYWEKEKLEKQVKYLDENLKVAACFTQVKLVDENNNEIQSEKYVNFNINNRDRFEWLNHFFYQGNCLCHPSILIRKEVQLKYNLFTYGLKSLPDFYRWVKLCLYHEIYIYPEKLTCFRVRRAGINTSGYSYENIVRFDFEITKVLELYKRLGEEELIKVFPQTKKYKKNNYFNPLYALARICIDEAKEKQYINFGYNLIYELLQNDNTRKDILKHYNYTKKDFSTETGKIDLYNKFDLNLIQNSSLYFANNNKDYSEERKISKQSFIKSDGTFELLFSNINKDVTCFRIDPDEGKYRYYEDIHIYVNNKEVKYTSNCNEVVEEKHFFYHKDPIFFPNFEGKINEVYMTAKTNLIEIDKIIEYVTNQSKKNLKRNNFITRLKLFFSKHKKG